MQTVVTGQLKGEVLAKAHVYPTVRARAIASKAMKAIGESSPGASVIYTETTTLARLVTTPVKMIKDKRATKATITATAASRKTRTMTINRWPQRCHLPRR